MVAKDLTQIKELIKRQDLKRADMLVSKLLRSAIPAEAVPSAIMCKAEVRLLQGRADDVITLIKELDEYIDNPISYIKAQEMLADAHLMRYENAHAGFANRNDLTIAMSVYENILDICPRYENSGWIHYQRGRIFLAQNETQQAQQALRQALFSASILATLTAYCFERLAFIAHYEDRDYYQAGVLLDKALHTYPEHANPDWLARLYLMRSRVLRNISVREAEKSALDGLKIARQLASQPISIDKMLVGEALFSLAELLCGEPKRQKDVVTYLQEFFQTQRTPLGVDVTWSRAYEMLGNAHLQLGDYDSAIRAYESVLLFNPDYPWLESLYLCVSRAKLGLGNYEGVIQTIDTLLKQAESDNHAVSDYRVFLLQADAYKELAQHVQMREAVMKAVEIAHVDLVDEIKNQYLS